MQSSKSRESSPSVAGSVSSRRSIERELQYNLQKLKDAVHDVQQNKSRPKMRRANSSEKDAAGKYSINGQRQNRRSLSLEPSNRGGSLADDQSNIWSRSMQDSDSVSSLQSLDKMSDISQDRYYSMDSRLSGGSTQSEVITKGETKKKKKGLMGTLKKLTKSRSVEDQSGGTFYKHSAAGSDSSIGTNEEGSTSGSKVDLKGKITGMFKRGGSSSRSNSLERKIQVVDTSSLQRPIKISTSSRTSVTPEPRATVSYFELIESYRQTTLISL